MAESDNSVRSPATAAADDPAAADNDWSAALRPDRLFPHGMWTKWVWLAVFAAALVVWVQLKPAEGMALRLPVAATNVLAPLAALLISLPPAVRLWRRCRGGGRQPGDVSRVASAVAFSLAFLLFTAAQCAWYYYELLRREPPFPSWADAGYLSTYPCLIAAVLLLPARRLSGLQRGRVLMDSVMTLAAVGTFSWYFLLGPAILNAAETPLAKVLAAAYPVADLLVLFCLLLTMARVSAAAPPPGMMPLCLGLLIIVVTDVVFGYQSLRGAYVPASLVGVGRPVGYLLLALGASALPWSSKAGLAAAEPSPGGDAVASGIAALLPYALVPLVGALVLGTLYEPDDGLVIGVYVGSGLVVLLVVLRQVLAIRQNARLYEEVSRAYGQLEQSHRSLESANTALAQSEERFRAAAQSASDLIYEYDTATGAIDWFGDIDGQLGHPDGAFPRTLAAWEESVHPEDRERVVAALDSHITAGTPFDVEYRVRRADGQYRHWVDRGRLVGRGGGRPGRVVGVVSDVTERQRADALESERAGLRQAVSAMEGVLGVVGHELRTPLAGLRAMSEFLLTDAGSLSTDCEQMLSGINQEVVRMSETVNDLLEAARLNSGLAKWKWTQFELAPACADALDPIRPLMDEDAVRIECDVESGCTMRGDADAVRRLVLNLVSNARRFTTAGSIRVGAKQVTGGGHQWVEVSVTDTGAGIPPEIRDRLGEAFALNAGLVGPNHVSGTGLGLAICKGIALAHGGALSIRSELGKGTTVVAKLRADLPGAVTEQGKGAVAGPETPATTCNGR